MLKLSRLLFVAALVAAPSLAHADHAAIGGSSNHAGPINTQTAGTLPAGKFSAGLHSKYIQSSPFNDVQLIEKASGHIHAHSTDFAWVNSVNGSYGITEDFMATINVPYIYRENIRAGTHSHSGGITSNTVTDFGDSGGLGDISLMGKYRFLKNQGFESSVMFGLEIPTGSTDKSRDGVKMEAEHQPGSGSWNPAMGFAVSKQMGPWSFDASLLYAWGMEGSQQTDLGDRANYGIAVTHRIGGEDHDHGHGKIHKHEAWDLVLELNGEWFGQQQSSDRKNDDSGGTVMYLSPGLRYTSGDAWAAHVSVGVPVRDAQRQGHPDTDFKITAGIGKAF